MLMNLKERISINIKDISLAGCKLKFCYPAAAFVQNLFCFMLPAVFCIVCGLFVSCGISGGGGSGTAASAVTSPASADPVTNVFRFTTSDAENYTQHPVEFMGTAVFYKIYSSESAANSAVSSIRPNEKTADSTVYANLTSRGYQKLWNLAVIIPPAQTDQSVVLRLSNETAYAALVSPVVPGYATPHRGGTSSGDFNFTSSYYPLSTDSDFTGIQTDEGPWYVAAYSAVVMHDTDGTNKYSGFSYLGYVKITRE